MIKNESEANSIKFPSITDQAHNLLQQSIDITKRLIKDGKIIASSELQEKRWETCKICEELKINRCLKCGCVMPIKIKLEEAKCPIGKW